MAQYCQNFSSGRCWTWHCPPCAGVKRLIISRNLRQVLDDHPDLRVCWWLPMGCETAEEITDAWRRFRMAVRKTEGFPDRYVWALTRADVFALHVTTTRRYSDAVFQHYWENLYDGNPVETWRATPDEIEHHWCQNLGHLGDIGYLGNRYGSARDLPNLSPRGEGESSQRREDPPEVADSRLAWGGN